MLTNSLNDTNNQNKHTAEDKKDLNLQIDRLKTQIKQLTQIKDNATEEIQKLNKTQNINRENINNYEEKIGILSNLEEESSSRMLLNQRLENEIIILKKEKESLVALLSQKDRQQEAYISQSERSIRTLQLKITALERANVIATATTDRTVVAATTPYSAMERYIYYYYCFYILLYIIVVNLFFSFYYLVHPAVMRISHSCNNAYTLSCPLRT